MSYVICILAANDYSVQEWLHLAASSPQIAHIANVLLWFLDVVTSTSNTFDSRSHITRVEIHIETVWPHASR